MRPAIFPMPRRTKYERFLKYGQQFRHLPNLDTLTHEQAVHFITRYTTASSYDAWCLLREASGRSKYAADDPGKALIPIANKLARYVRYRLGNQLEEAEYIYSLLPTYAQFRAAK